MKTVQIRDLVIGEGMPKVLVPIVGKTTEEILEKGREIADMAFDIVEWRVDFYEDALDRAALSDTLVRLRETLGEKPLLFTFRTAREGGMREIDPETYAEWNIAAAESGCADLVDVEIFAGDDLARRCVEGVHRAGKAVIGSNHEFEHTPSKADIIYRLRKMQDMDADILKIAVMPRNKADVLTLLCATEEMSRCYADRPLVTMSMSPIGVISRICGEAFGSAMTFGAVGQASAPGQIPVEALNTSLRILHAAG